MLYIKNKDDKVIAHLNIKYYDSLANAVADASRRCKIFEEWRVYMGPTKIASIFPTSYAWHISIKEELKITELLRKRKLSHAGIDS